MISEMMKATCSRVSHFMSVDYGHSSFVDAVLHYNVEYNVGFNVPTNSCISALLRSPPISVPDIPPTSTDASGKVGKCREMSGSVGKCREMSGIVGKCREM